MFLKDPSNYDIWDLLTNNRGWESSWKIEKGIAGCENIDEKRLSTY